jgi:glyoxylase-like metal-dependent hydrolase (beta-lactamase superfamily II)
VPADEDGTPPTPSPVETAGDGLLAVDTLTAGMTRVTAGYLLTAPRPALVECGPARSIGSVIAGLRQLGMDPGDLAYLVVSHIHLDHAGGAGDIARAFPSATVVCADVGARHVVDPERLNASSQRVYGPLYDEVYGPCTPVPGERVLGVDRPTALDLGGGRRLELFPAPGHAKHHIGILDPDSGDLFVGDSVGVKMPGMAVLRPATPPPDFDHVLAQRTLDRYLDIDPTAVHLAHYGRVDPPRAALEEASERLRLWVEVADRAWAQDHDLEHVAETLGRRFADEVAVAPDDADARRRVELLSGVRSNAMGLVRYFEQRAEGRTEPAPG